MINFSNIVVLLALIATGLMAGLFYSYSCSVNPGLNKLSDENYLAAMQSINGAILNPAFFICFFGALILLPLSAYFNYGQAGGLKFWLLAVAAVVYAVGLFGVTVVFNVPLNNMLDKVDLTLVTAQQLSEIRQAFEKSWNRWHGIRTVAVILSFILTGVTCIFPESLK